jgi:hypothetical protein
VWRTFGKGDYPPLRETADVDLLRLAPPFNRGPYGAAFERVVAAARTRLDQIGLAGRLPSDRTSRTADGMKPTFPERLLDEAAWDFEGQKPFATRRTFEAALERYRGDNAEDEPPDGEPWIASRTVLAAQRVLLDYFADPTGDRGTTYRVLIASDNSDGFEAGELLFKIHNIVVGRLATARHHWFEGLAFDGVDADGTPVYSLIGGS